MKRCLKCGLELKFILPFQRRFVYPHVCRPATAEMKAFRNPAADVTFGALGVGPEWAKSQYGEYYAKSVSVYSAIRIRAENVVRPPLVVYRSLSDGDKEPVGNSHPLQALLTKVNPFWTRGDLWRATSTYLDLFGSAFWLLKKPGPNSLPSELWPLRPDRMRIIPDRDKYIAGFEYHHDRVRQPLRVDEVIWFRFFNPLDEFAGMSPVAPARLSMDMGIEALRHNKKIFENGMLWGNVGLTMENGTMAWTQEQVDDFYDRLRKRFASTENSWKPPILSNLKPIQMGFSQRDMEFMESLRWSLGDVIRAYGVPEPMLNLKDITFANADAAERIFWRQTMMSLLLFLQEEINEMLAPQFGEDLTCEFDLSVIGALQEDRDKLEARQREDVKLNIQTINEVRGARGLEPVPWGDEPPAVPSFGSPFGGEEEGLEAAPRMHELDGRSWRLFRRDWSDHALDSIGTLHVRSLFRNEKLFLILQRQLFAEQKQDLIRKLKLERSMSGLKTKGLGDFLFNPLVWAAQWGKRGLPLFLFVLTQAAEGQVTAFRLPVGFNPATEGVKNWLRDRVDFWAQRTNEETAKLLVEELENGIANGESIKEIQGRVERVFAFSDSVRSEMIARTEVHAASIRGSLQAYKQSGVVEAKMWLATLDDRVREHHLDAHRQVVPLDAKFEVGGEFVDGPGDGSASNAINCRCALVPVLASAKALPKQSTQTGNANGSSRTNS